MTADVNEVSWVAKGTAAQTSNGITNITGTTENGGTVTITINAYTVGVYMI